MGMTAGADIISYTYSNACGVAFATHPITNNPLANAGTIAGPIAVCVAATITLSDASGVEMCHGAAKHYDCSYLLIRSVLLPSVIRRP